MRSDLNSNAKLMADIAATCFLITNETDFDAHLNYSAHVDSIEVRVFPQGNWTHPVLSFEEYLCCNSRDRGFDKSSLGLGKAPEFRAFLKRLRAFLAEARAQ